MKKDLKKPTLSNKSKVIIGAAVGAMLGIASATGVVNITKTEEGKITIDISTPYSIELPEAEIIETEDGNIQVLEAPVVENIEGNQTSCPEGEEECGQGQYVYAPTDTIANFTNYVLNGCWNVDFFAGAQCWDLGALWFMNYTQDGRTLSTCGTGAAKGAWDCKEQNAGDDFELVYEASKIQPGDWIIFGGGEFGHVGMALSYNEDGYVSLLGQNQGGKPCEGGGSSANIIKISLKNFLGAFRPKAFVKQEPEQEPEPTIPITGCEDWNVVEGDTMSGIMLVCEGVIVYGEPMNQYADSWISQIYNPGYSVYYGWTHGNGYGLYANDYLLHDVK